MEGGPYDSQCHELRDEWEGCWTTHVARDRYRVIWIELEPEAGYDDDGTETEDIPIVILRVGPKTDARGQTIYETKDRPDLD